MSRTPRNAESTHSTRHSFGRQLSVDERDRVKSEALACWNTLQSYESVPNSEAYTGTYRDQDTGATLRMTAGQELVHPRLILSYDFALREGDFTYQMSRKPDFPLWGGRANAYNADAVALLGSIKSVKHSDLYNSRGIEVTDDLIWELLKAIPYSDYAHQVYYMTETSYIIDHTIRLETKLAIGRKTQRKAQLSGRPRTESRIIVQRQDTMTDIGQQALRNTTLFSVNQQTGEVDAHIATTGSSEAILANEPSDRVDTIIDVCKLLSTHILQKNDPFTISRQPSLGEPPQN